MGYLCWIVHFRILFYTVLAMKNNIPLVGFKSKKISEIGFEIMTLESLHQRSEGLKFPVHKSHSIDFHQLLFLTEGTLECAVDFSSYEIKAGDFLIVTRKQVQSFSLNESQKGFMILFTDVFLNQSLSGKDYFAFSRFFCLSKFPPVVCLEAHHLNALTSLNQLLYSEFRNEMSYGRSEILRNLLKVILLKLEGEARQIVKEPESPRFTFFVQFKNLLAKDFKVSRDAKYYAQSLNVSYRKLNDICKEFTSKTAKSFIDHYVLLESKRLLLQTDMTIKEVSYHLGFDEPTNFVKYFKQYAKMLPKKFRDTNL